MLSEKREALLDVVGSDAALTKMNDILREDGISVTAYAKIFCMLEFELTADNAKLTYNSIDAEWRRNKRKVSDAKIFGCLSKLCEVIRLFIQCAWEESLFSAWMTDKPLKKAEAAMEDMESLNALHDILTEAATLMEKKDNSGRMVWEGQAAADDPSDEDES